MVYNGPTDESEIKRFIVQVSDAYVKEFQTTMPPTAPNQMTQHGRPGQGGRGMGGEGMGGRGMGGEGMGGRGMGGRGMGGEGMAPVGRSQSGIPSTRPQAGGSTKPNLDLACSLDDMACLEHSVKKYSGCYVSMQEAYTNKIGK